MSDEPYLYPIDKPSDLAWVMERKDVWRIVMKVASEKLLAYKKKGKRYQDIAKELGVPGARISEVMHGKYMSKKVLKLLILYDYVKVDDVLPKVKREHLRILKTMIPDWA